jgi:hypothetical protein
MEFYTKIITPYGEFKGEVLNGTSDQYNKLLEITKHFHKQEVYHQFLEDGTFFVCGEQTIKQSIIMIKIKED